MYTIKNLFEAIDYCNRVIKIDNEYLKQHRTEFYELKKKLIYHIVKNHAKLGVKIDDIHIDVQKHESKDIELFKLQLSYGDTILIVHTVFTSKFNELINILKISLSDKTEYTNNNDDASIIFNQSKFEDEFNVIKYFVNHFKLNTIFFSAKNCSSLEQKFNTICYFHFNYNIEIITKLIKNSFCRKDIVKISGKNMRPIYVYMHIFCRDSDNIFAFLRKGDFHAVSKYNLGENNIK